MDRPLRRDRAAANCQGRCPPYSADGGRSGPSPYIVTAPPRRPDPHPSSPAIIMAEVVLGFVYRASTNGLGGVYLEAAFAGASGLVALGAKAVSKLREGTQEPADVSGSPVNARRANATVQGDAGDRAVRHPASADGT